MSFKCFFEKIGKRIEEYCNEPWHDSKILSRKWWLIVAVVATVIVLDIVNKDLSSDTLNFLQYIIVAYLGVQGAIDFFKYKANKSIKNKKSKNGGDSPES